MCGLLPGMVKPSSNVSSEIRSARDSFRNSREFLEEYRLVANSVKSETMIEPEIVAEVQALGVPLHAQQRA